MRYLPSATTSFQDLTSHPVRWILSRLAIYLSAAVVGGVVFMVGATIYAYVWPNKPAANPIPAAEDTVEPPKVSPQKKAPSPAIQPNFNEALVAGYIGAPIITNGVKIGAVDGILFGADGKPMSVVVGRTDGGHPERIVVPYEKVGWQTENEEPTNRFEPAAAGIVDEATIAASEAVQKR